MGRIADNTTPIVSVLMTAYNREDYISEAIDSVLASDFQDFELIIVDDCSTDNTPEIIRGYAAMDSRIRYYINEHNLGDYPNRNKAASFATGEYIKYVDSDDLIFPNTLGTMVEAMDKQPGAAFGFCDCHPTIKKKYPILFSGEQAIRKHFLGGGLLQAGPTSSIIRRKPFENIGRFSGKRFVSDYEAWLYLSLDHSVLVLPPGLIWIRSHAGQEMDVGKLEYYSLNYKLHREFIKHPKCPFSSAEKKKILFNYRILLGRRVYQRLLKWFGLKKTLQTIKDAGENWTVFLFAFLPMKRIEK